MTEFDLESEMHFITEPQCEFCKPETTELYKSINNGKPTKGGIRVVDYIRAQKTKNNRHVLRFIEAKDISDPKYLSIDEVAEKFSHSLQLFAAVMLNKRPDDKSEFEKFRKTYAKANFQMILIIKTLQDYRLSNFEDALRQKLKPLWKIWKLNPNQDILVWDEEKAIEQKLVRPQNICDNYNESKP
ncbi:MAG: hypothetical protein FWC40_02835 [Proteobacteria bacterium]|nr:hypothetical protein [Pseudomonadota bacterium]